MVKSCLHGMDGGFNMAILKKILKFVGYLFLLTIILIVIRCNIDRSKLHAETYDNSNIPLPDLLKAVARETNKALPSFGDKYTRMDNLEAKNNTLIFNHTLMMPSSEAKNI